MLRPIQIPHLLSKDARQKGVDALTSFFYEIVANAIPFFRLWGISWIVKYAIKTLVSEGGEFGILGINREVVNKSVNKDLKDILDIWDEVNLKGEDMSDDEIKSYEERQIRASNKFLSIGRKRL